MRHECECGDSKISHRQTVRGGETVYLECDELSCSCKKYKFKRFSKPNRKVKGADLSDTEIYATKDKEITIYPHKSTVAKRGELRMSDLNSEGKPRGNIL